MSKSPNNVTQSQQPYHVPLGYEPPEVATNQTEHVVVFPQQTRTIMTGGCINCNIGILEDRFTACGILLAILFGPLGCACCCLLMEKRCTNCEMVYD